MVMVIRSGLVVQIVDNIETLGRDRWNDLWCRAGPASVFARYEWASAWWDTQGVGGVLKLYCAESDGKLVGILPLALPDAQRQSNKPMVLVGDEHVDYAAILIDKNVPHVLGALLDVVAQDIQNNHGLLFRDVREDTAAGMALSRLVQPLSARWLIAQRVRCPRSTLNSERLTSIVNKESLKRHSRKLAKTGRVEVRHRTDAQQIEPRLDCFFEQHIARWAGTSSPSLFMREANRALYRALVRGFDGTGLLIFTEILLDGRMVAAHLGFLSEGDLIWYKPSFDINLAKLSPGEVLIRELFLYASSVGLEGVDFTRGGEAFKSRFCDQVREAVTFEYHPDRSVAMAMRAFRACRDSAKRNLPPAFLRRLRSSLGRP